MTTTKKRILSVLTVASVAATMFTGMINASAAPAYGSEWGGRNSDSSITDKATTTTTTTTATTTTTTDEEEETTSASAPATLTYGSFNDVPTTHWAYDSVERCAATMWFDGYPDGSFRPDGKILRAEALKVFVTFLGLPLNTVTTSSYYDVSATAWYAPYIEAGKDLFPTRTALDGQAKFQPDMPVTREDTIYALVKALRYDQLIEFADLSVLNMFSDQNSITSSIKPYVAIAVKYGLAAGYDDGTIGAQDPLTRAEFATLLYRASYIGPLEETVTNKVTSSIIIEPSTYKEIMVGESFEITARIYYTDGTDEDYTSHLNPYTEDQNYIIVTNKNKVTGNKEGTVIVKYNDDQLRDRELVVSVKPNPEEVVTPEPTPEATPEPPIVDDEDDDKDMEVPDFEIKEEGKVELAFIIDTTGSMADEIYNVKENVAAFASYLETKGVDLKMSVVEYRDITCDGKDSTKVHYNGTSPWHTDSTTLISTLGDLSVSGGGDYEETAIDGFARILDNRYMDWSGDAYKFAVLLTDANYKLENTYGYTSMDEIVSKLAGKNITTSVITDPYCYNTYKALYETTGGICASVTSDFSKTLSDLADKIIDVSITAD